MDPLTSLFDPGEDDCHGMPESLPPEVEEGNIEYKLKLVNPSDYRFEHLVTQMKWRLQEGQGEAIYEIGVEDSGMLAGLTEHEMQASLHTLSRMAHRLKADISILREKQVESADGSTRQVAEVLVRKVPENQQFIDLRLAVLGNVDAGKSTLLGVLTQGELDNGRGRARLNLFRHLHEIQSGRTSSISHEILGFDSQGEVVNYSESRTVEEICESSTKLITLIDLCGHHKYLKTTIFGLTGYSPDFAMLVVSANTGIAGTTKEHLGYALALGVPIFVVVSKVDQCGPRLLERTVKQLEKLLKSPGCKKVPFRVQSEDDALTAAASFHSESSTASAGNSQQQQRATRKRKSDTSIEDLVRASSCPSTSQVSCLSHSASASSLKQPSSSSLPHHHPSCALKKNSSLFKFKHSICPIFLMSSVTGENLELLTKFLNVLPPLHNPKEREQIMQEYTELQIDEIYYIGGVGVIAGGTLLRGTIKEGDSLLVGPTDDGEFLNCSVQSLHRNRLPCRVVTAGQSASVSLGHFDDCHIRRGMVLLSPALSPQACLEFEADIYLLFHTNYICKGFQTVVHVGNVCQTAKIIKMNKGCIQTNEKAVVTFRFNNRPEFVRLGSRLLFREGRTKGMGEITRIYPVDLPIR